MNKSKIGDVFSAKVDADGKRFFQLVAFDLTQLNSDVIRVFKKIYNEHAMPTLEEVVNQEIDFYVHCVAKMGLKMNLWEYLGNESHVGDVSNLLFRCTSEYGVKAGEEPVKISYKWYVWHINDDHFTQVGKLETQYEDSYIGLVVNPLGVMELLRGNKYPPKYPDYK